MKQAFLLPIIIFLLLACKSETNSIEKPDYTSGIVALETADIDSSITYYYYLPSHYDTAIHYPAIYFIDAHQVSARDQWLRRRAAVDR